MRGHLAFAALGVAILVGGGGCGKQDGRPGELSDSLVVPERAGLFLEATQHYGPLVVREGEYFAQADERPWSGYWYPLRDNLLVAASPRNGNQPTLDKYDRYAKQLFGRVSASLQEELDKHLFNPMAETWEGRCGAWALASVLEPEPRLPEAGVRVPGADMTFFTRDVKALVILSYETVDNSAFHRFGQPYTGAPGDDYQDIYPDQFHRVLVSELYERHRPVVMDDTAGVEVWNTPIWQGLTTLKRDLSDPHVMHVFTRVKGAQSVKVSPDYAGLSNDTTYQYTYDLVGSPQQDGSLLVKYGKWTGESVQDHPDYLLTLPEKGAPVRHASLNQQLDAEVIHDILSKTGATGNFRLP